MAVKGIFVSDAGGLNERTGDLNSTILYEERGGTVPLFALSAGMTQTTANNAVVSWEEEGIMSSRCVITNVPNPVGNIIVVHDASWLHENHILMVEQTGEYLIILGVSGNTLTVQRGVGGTGVTPINISESTETGIQLIGTAFEEASERPTAIATSPYPRSNVCQIFRNSWDISGTAQATTYRHGSREAKNKATAALLHAEDIERTLIWGKRHIGVINNKPYRQMDGILAQIRTNIFAGPAGGLTRRVLDDYVERLFSRNIKGQPNERITFGGNAAVRALNEIAWRYGSYNISEKTNSFGMNIKNYMTPFGDLTLMVHPLMNENPIWSHQLYSFHPASLEIAWLRKTFHQDGDDKGKASDLRDATSGVYTSELTVKLKLESTAAVLTDVAVDHYDPCNPCVDGRPSDASDWAADDPIYNPQEGDRPR